MTNRLLGCCIAILAGVAASTGAHAQSYPAKPIKLVVGFAAGGPTDVIARVIAQDMTASLGQTVLVENKTGANALIATQEVKRAAPDGYTLLMTTLSHNVNAILLADKKPYDPIKDFEPITLVAFLPLVMVTKPDSPYASVQDVVKAAKAKPGEVSYASAGNGGSAHLAAALVENLSGTQMTHVPFRGNAPALTEVIRAALKKPETREKLSGLGAITEGGSTPAEFRAWLQKDADRWARVIKAAGVKAE